MKIYSVTQDQENYAIDAQGNLGTGMNAYWKFKGGSDYFIPLPEGFNFANSTEVVKSITEKIEIDNDAYRSYVIDWEVVANDFMTRDVQLQLEYDGEITYPTQVLEAVI